MRDETKIQLAALAQRRLYVDTVALADCSATCEVLAADLQQTLEDAWRLGYEARKDGASGVDAARARRKSLIRSSSIGEVKTKFSFRRGDRVKITVRCNPKYLRGAVGTVVRRLRTRVVVDFDVPHRRFHKGVRCHPEYLQKIEK